VLIVGLGQLDNRRLAPCGDVAEEAQGIGLVPTFLALTGERQRMLSKGVGLVEVASQSLSLPPERDYRTPEKLPSALQ
jgi:hypothetical protein